MKSFLSSAVIKLAIFIALAAILINDTGSIVSGHYLLGERASEIADAGASGYRLTRSPTRALNDAEMTASELGVTILQFEVVNRERIDIEIEIPNHGTWVAHRFTTLRPYLNASTSYTKQLN